MKKTMRQVIKKAGGNKAFSERFCVPIRTVEGWNAGRGCPQYTVDAFAELVESYAPLTGSIHILFKLRWSLGGFVDARPIEAFTTRKKANAKMREKNEKATSCDYVVKSVKLSE